MRLGSRNILNNVFPGTGASLEEKLKVAESEDTPGEILAMLAEDHFRHVRKAVASNRSTPSRVLHSMVCKNEENSTDIQQSIAGNPNASPKTLARLAGVRFRLGNICIRRAAVLYRIRSTVAENPSTPLWLLKFFITQSRKDDTMLFDNHISQVIAGNPNISSEMFKRFANSTITYERRSVASNPNIPEHLLFKLALDTDELVRSRVAINPKTPEGVLVRLSWDIYATVVGNVASNVNTPIDTLIQLADDEGYDERIRQYCSENPTYVEHQRALVLRNLNMNEGLLPADLVDEIWKR